MRNEKLSNVVDGNIWFFYYVVLNQTTFKSSQNLCAKGKNGTEKELS